MIKKIRVFPRDTERDICGILLRKVNEIIDHINKSTSQEDVPQEIADGTFCKFWDGDEEPNDNSSVVGYGFYRESPGSKNDVYRYFMNGQWYRHCRPFTWYRHCRPFTPEEK